MGLIIGSVILDSMAFSEEKPSYSLIAWQSNTQNLLVSSNFMPHIRWIYFLLWIAYICLKLSGEAELCKLGPWSLVAEGWGLYH